MKFKLLFFDYNADYIAEYQHLTNSIPGLELVFEVGDVRDVIRRNAPQILVSPANCHGWMDGGIDAIYMEMFPEIEPRVKARIHQFGIKTARGDPVLPIGSAVLVPTGPCVAGPIPTKLLACVPTMVTPQIITGTPTNVYWAMRGLLNLIHMIDRDGSWDDVTGKTQITIACPCLGTGVGELEIGESTRQVQAALFAHASADKSICDPKCDVAVITKPWAYVLTNHANKRPDE